jgi:ketosteroid isomerase-like protein
MTDLPDDLPAAVLERLLGAINAHDLDAMVSCFAHGYVNETPVHPERGFQGSAQVRANWSQILGNVPDLFARVPRTAADGDSLWTEWEISGTRRDGAAFLMRGVVIFVITGGAIASARFYLDAVEQASGDVSTHVRSVAGPTPGTGPVAVKP